MILLCFGVISTVLLQHLIPRKLSVWCKASAMILNKDVSAAAQSLTFASLALSLKSNTPWSRYITSATPQTTSKKQVDLLIKAQTTRPVKLSRAKHIQYIAIHAKCKSCIMLHTKCKWLLYKWKTSLTHERRPVFNSPSLTFWLVSFNLCVLKNEE